MASKKKFNVAFSTIGTNTFFRFVKLILKYPVDRKFWWRCFISGIVSLIAEPFRWYENLKYARKLKKVELPKSPVFIMGHWRSGTTLMHNLICQDKQFSFITTYQGVFVNVFFSGRWFFRNLMKALMPERRATDNVKLSAGFPQEEGFALANLGSFAFYNYWYFPKLWKVFYKKYVRCEDVSKEEMAFYQKQYKKLIAQSIYFHGRKEFVSKNPPNSGRIEQILEMFPDARFIYLYRNPLKVFQSTVSFFAGTLPALQMQDFSNDELEEMVFGLYEEIIRDYEEQKMQIPKSNLIEVRYEDFVKDPLVHIEGIYKHLELPNFEQAYPFFKTYLETQKKFSKSKRSFTDEEKEKINKRLGFAVRLYGYN